MNPGLYKAFSDKVRYALDTNNSAGTHYLSTTKTMGSGTQCTFSVWIKLQDAPASRRIIGRGTGTSFGGGDYFNIHYGTESFTVSINTGGTVRGAIFSVANMNDGSWHHVFIQIDTTQGTDTNRVKLWLDNSAVSPFASSGSGYFTLSQSVLDSGGGWFAFRHVSSGGSVTVADLFVAEMTYVDGSIVDISRFVRSTAGGLKPIRYRGPFGTEGFKLEFIDSTNFGKDLADNGDWTENESGATLLQITDAPG